jgi:hypothetical protein
MLGYQHIHCTRDSGIYAYSLVSFDNNEIYLDEASVKLGNCLYVIPGSNSWPDQLAATMTAHLTENGIFPTSFCVCHTMRIDLSSPEVSEQVELYLLRWGQVI